MGDSEMSADDLEWKDVLAIGERVFSVRVDGSELEWARRAWEILERNDLTTYSTEIGRWQVPLRLFSDCDHYLDFCEVAWGEGKSSLG